jgi:RNA polymerase sigma-70 factor (ECF subfamily)
MTADFSLLEAHRPALTGYCYRMLGSAFDADDAVQETMIRAWRSFDRFDGRASVKTWLYRIATNVCLDELKSRGRRARPMEEGTPSSGSPSVESLTQRPREYWIEPILDSRVLPAEADPSERAALRQSVRLAFVAALQNLAPTQRVALLMTEVLGCSAAEAAETLETSIPSVNSALQRARATLAKRNMEEPAELTEAQQGMLSRYVAAFESYDVDGLTALCDRTRPSACLRIRCGYKDPKRFERGCSVWDAAAAVRGWFPRLPPAGRPSLNIDPILKVATRHGPCSFWSCLETGSRA